MFVSSCPTLCCSDGSVDGTTVPPAAQSRQRAAGGIGPWTFHLTSHCFCCCCSSHVADRAIKESLSLQAPKAPKQELQLNGLWSLISGCRKPGSNEEIISPSMIQEPADTGQPVKPLAGLPLWTLLDSQVDQLNRLPPSLLTSPDFCVRLFLMWTKPYKMKHDQIF